MIVKKVKYLFEGYNISVNKEGIDMDESNPEFYANAIAQRIVNNNSASEQDDRNLADLLTKSILKFGFNEGANPLLSLMKRIEGDPKQYKQMPEKLNYLYNIIVKDNNYTDKEYIKPWITKSSLYKNRDLNGFKYTINAINLVNNPTEVAKLGFDADKLRPKELFYGNNEVKSPKDIYATIESWSNEKSGDTDIINSGKYTFEDVLRAKGKLDNTGTSSGGVDIKGKPTDIIVNVINSFLYNARTNKYDISNKDIVDAITKFVNNGGHLKKIISEEDFKSRGNQANNQKIADIIIKQIINGNGRVNDAFKKKPKNNKR